MSAHIAAAPRATPADTAGVVAALTRDFGDRAKVSVIVQK